MGPLANGAESSESDQESEPARAFTRKISTNKRVNGSAAAKEGFLMKQTWRFQRWRRRYFKLRGRVLYYAKSRESPLFDEIELIDPIFAECSIKNVNHSFQVITPCRSLVLCAETRREMEEWLAALKGAAPGGPPDMLTGDHHWYATSHARPTYCNVCREALHGVPPHGLSCEVCKCKAHKKCAARAPPNCKWTTLASIGADIIEDEDGNITMPHQWMEGNLPVASKCSICDKTCGSVLRLQDWRCLWCRASVHATCRPSWRARCPLPPWRVSLVPPTALHAAADDAWQPARPPHASPLLVFVNSKSGDNQGVKFLRRFKQLLNPAQVFDLTAGGGPAPGLRLFRHLDPFRVLVCSGDGSVGWVLAEIDSLNMHNQCQVAVLPLGTGNDLARVLGWGAACDDDAHLPLLLERYEQASAKMLDRWSIMAFERPLGSGAGTCSSGATGAERGNKAHAIEEAINSHLDIINQSIETGVVCSTTAELLRGDVKELLNLAGGERGREARARLAALLDTLRGADGALQPLQPLSNKMEKEELNQRARQALVRGAEVRRRSDSLRRAVSIALKPSNNTLAVQSSCETRGSWELLPAPKQFADGSRRSSAASDAGQPPDYCIPDVDEDLARLFPLCGSQPSKSPDLLSISDVASQQTLALSPNLELVNSNSCLNLLKLRDQSAGQTCDVSFRVPSLIVSDEATADENNQSLTTYESDKMTIIDTDIQTNFNEEAQFASERKDSEAGLKSVESDKEEDKDLSDVLSAMSNEECSLGSEMIDQKAFQAPQNIDGEDVNGHICHIDSPETSDTTCPNSETIHGESIIDDMSSVLGQDLIMAIMGRNGDLDTFTDETTLFTSDTTSEIPLDSRNPSLEKYDDRIFNFLHRSRKVKDLEEKFGFENKVFNLGSNTEPPKYCSLAQFVEGNDIARKSFKRHLRHSKKLDKNEASKVRETILNEENEILDATKIEGMKGSCSNLSSSVGGETVIARNGGLLDVRLKEDFGESTPIKDNEYNVFHMDATKKDNLTIPQVEFEAAKKDFLTLDVDGTEAPIGARMFPRVSVVVEPPSPSGSDGKHSSGLGAPTGLGGLAPFWARERRCSDNGPRSLLDVDRCSSATRRISCGSLFQPGEADRLSKSASSLWGGGSSMGGVLGSGGARRALPIINPLVRLPAWPHVSQGLVGRCLLANADALCAAVSPLMDPQETLLEGFYERAVMNNYFGIGIDAKISLDFHQKREEHPEKCRSRARNYMWYGVLGSREWLQRTYRHLGQRVQLECDGQRIPLPELQGIVVLNIPSFMGGTNFWGGEAVNSAGPFLPPSFDDRVLEVVAVFGSAQMAASRLINLQRHRIAQCRNVQINILGSEGVPVQVDGEAWLQPPGMIRIMHKNRAQVLCRSRALETSLKSWGEKQQRLSLSPAPLASTSFAPSAQSSNHSAAPPSAPPPPTAGLQPTPPPDELPAAELAQLLIFIEAANTLVKWVKMSSITAGTSSTSTSSSSSSTSTVYTRACETAAALDELTPAGRLLPAQALRKHLPKLVRLLGELCTLAESTSGGPPLQQALVAAKQQLKLVRCQDGLAFIQPHGEMEPNRGMRGWLRSGRRASSVAGASALGASGVKSWGVSEVASWLSVLQLSEHADAFAKHDITGRELLTLARRDLKELGVTKIGHVKRILQAIKEMQ